jgi:hypothetical protein
MRPRYIILLAAVLSLAAVLAAAGLALGQNATAGPSTGPTSQDSAPLKIWPRPLAEMPAASSPAISLPTATPTATPMSAGDGSSGYAAKVVDKGIDTKTVSPGGTIAGYAVIRNTGNDLIKDALVHLDVMKPRENAHAIKVATLEQPLSGLYIAPGDQKRAEFSISLPGSVAAGDYVLQATVEANGQQADTFTLPVTVS